MKKYLLIIPALLLLVWGVTSLANPIYLAKTKYLTGSSATTTPSLVTPASTPTFDFDLYDTTDSTNSQLPDKGILLVQHTASTSASLVNIQAQYSQNGFDWFTLSFSEDYSTTTNPARLDVDTKALWGLYGNTVASTSRHAIPVDFYARYVRFNFSSGSGTSTVWAELVPQKQR